MISAAITGRQKKLLEAIVTMTAAQGYPPTLRELATELRVNHSTVQFHVGRLRNAGLLEPENGKFRSIRVKQS